MLFLLFPHVCPSYANLLEKLLEIFYEKWVKHANLARLLRFQVGILSTLHTVVFRANKIMGGGGCWTVALVYPGQKQEADSRY